MEPSIHDQLLVAYARQVVSPTSPTLDNHIRYLERQSEREELERCRRIHGDVACDREHGHPGNCAALIVF